MTQNEQHLIEAGHGLNSLVGRAQDILTQYLIPDGLTAPEAIAQLLALLDGPEQRSIQLDWKGAVVNAKRDAAPYEDFLAQEISNDRGPR